MTGGMASDLTAVVLAAGLGSRMGELRGPKGLLEVGGRAVLEHQLRALAACRVAQVVLVTGHQAARVEAKAEAFGSGTGVAVSFARNPDFAETGTAASTLIGLNAANPGDILVLEGDTLVTPAALADVLSDRTEARTLTDRHARWDQGSKIFTNPEGWVTDWAHRRRQPPGFSPEHATKTVNVTYLPAATARPAFERPLSRLARDPAAPVEFAFQDMVRAGHRIRAVEMAGRPWCEIDDPDDLARARSLPDFRVGPCAEARPGASQL